MYDEQTHFEIYLVSSNVDLLRRVEGLLKKRGYVGVTDNNGQIHYLIDGRRGAFFAERRIMELTHALTRASCAEEEIVKREDLVDEVLKHYDFTRSLYGYRYLRQALILLSKREENANRLGKGLFPLVAERFGVSKSSVERNIRYLFERLEAAEQYLVERQAHQYTLFDSEVEPYFAAADFCFPETTRFDFLVHDDPQRGVNHWLGKLAAQVEELVTEQQGLLTDPPEA